MFTTDFNAEVSSTIEKRKIKVALRGELLRRMCVGGAAAAATVIVDPFGVRFTVRTLVVSFCFWSRLWHNGNKDIPKCLHEMMVNGRNKF